MDIEIRKITELTEIYAILDLMKDIWTLSDLEIVASFEMKAVSTFGVLLGAFDHDTSDNKLVGFIYGFPRFPNSHHSHQMGVDKKYQSKNVGFLLKKAHRSLALTSTNPQVIQIEWTVDPLLGPNANLNFRKLGVICNTYYPNFYGDPKGAVDLYPSVPTDRILVKWNLTLDRVNDRFDNNNPRKPAWISIDDLFKEFPPLIELKLTNNRLQLPYSNSLGDLITEDRDEWSMEIPDDYTNQSKIDIEWAMKWRIAFRNICMSMFERGYYLIDFFSFPQSNKIRRNAFIFSRDIYGYKY